MGNETRSLWRWQLALAATTGGVMFLAARAIGALEEQTRIAGALARVGRQAPSTGIHLAIAIILGVMLLVLLVILILHTLRVARLAFRPTRSL